MKIRCRCKGTKFEVDVTTDKIKLICSKCHQDLLTDFGPRILKRVFGNLFEKFLGRI